VIKAANHAMIEAETFIYSINSTTHCHCRYFCIAPHPFYYHYYHYCSQQMKLQEYSSLE